MLMLLLLPSLWVGFYLIEKLRKKELAKSHLINTYAWVAIWVDCRTTSTKNMENLSSEKGIIMIQQQASFERIWSFTTVWTFHSSQLLTHPYAFTLFYTCTEHYTYDFLSQIEAFWTIAIILVQYTITSYSCTVYLVILVVGSLEYFYYFAIIYSAAMTMLTMVTFFLFYDLL